MIKHFITFLFCICFVVINAQQKISPWKSADLFQTNYFIENRGQFEKMQDHLKSVQFALQHNRQNFYFTSNGFSIQATKKVKRTDYKEPESKAHEEKYKEKLSKEAREAEEMIEESERYTLQTSWIDFAWQNINTNVMIEKTGKAPHSFSFGDAQYLSSGYKMLTYKNVYDGIDVNYEVNPSGGIKYSLLLKAGARLDKVSFKYLGSKIKLSKTKDGLRIKNEMGVWTETQLNAFYTSGEKIAIDYLVDGNEVRFKVQDALNASKDFIIDPVVTTLTSLTNNNIGYDIEYDLDGNLLVFGGESSPKVAKFDVLGNLLWTFMGTVVSTGWTTGFNIGNFVVDKHNNKIYVSDGLNAGGATAIRLTPSGVYDNFVSLPNPDLIEIWEMKINCVTGDVIAMGGGSSSDLNFGIIDTATATVNTHNVTGVLGGMGHQDILNATIGPSGEVYIIINSLTYAALDNHMFKVNASYTSSLWDSYCGYMNFTEPFNKSYLGSLSNGFNALASDSTYVYYYDGVNLKAFDAATGIPIGSPMLISGAGPKMQGGIYANVCHEVFIGSQGAIQKYSFNGSSFTLMASLSIPGIVGNIVTDIAYNSLNNLLYVSGDGFVATIDPQSTCSNGSSNLIQLSYTTFCPDRAFVTVTNPIAGAGYTFIWQDSSTNAILQTTQHLPGQNTDTISGLFDGKTYRVNVLLASACQVISNTIIFKFDCPGIKINLCPGKTYTLSNGTIIDSAGTYLDTLTSQAGLDSVIYVTLAYYLTYRDTIHAEICSDGQYVMPNGNSVNVTGFYTNSLVTQQGCDSIIVVDLNVVQALPQHYLGNDTSICENESIQLNQIVQIPNATYLWEDNSTNPMRTLSGAGIYILTISLPPCPSVVDTLELKYKDCSCFTFIPNAFSPNGDNRNDVFRPKLKCFDPPSNYYFQVFNRWGQRVYFTEKPEEGWDGMFYNELQELGTYMYSLQFVNSRTGKSEYFKGDVILIR